MSRDANFIKKGLPFFAILLGGAYGLHFFQEVRYEFRQVKKEDDNLEKLHRDLEKKGIQFKPKSVEEIYKEVAAEDTDNWANIRGPHENEDNSEYFKIQKEQRELREKARKDKLALLNGEFVDPGDNPPEPTLGIPRNNSLSASIRAERGSPIPESLDGFSIPDTPASSSAAQLPGPVPPAPVPDPFQASPSSSLSGQPPSHAASFARAAHPLDPQAQVADQQALAGLVELGFDEWTANLALLRTGNAGIEAAVTWIVERSNDSDFDSGSSDDEDETEEGREQPADMGASQSTGEGAGPSNAVGFDVIKALAKNARTHKMVFVANMSLKMGAGKLAAQVGHACLAVYQKAVSTEEGRVGIQSWERMGAVKVVLKGESTEQLMELLKQAKEVGCSAYLVADAGYTQIPAGSRTVLGVFGPKEAVDSVCGQLKLL